MSNNVHVSSSNKRAKSWEKGFLTKAFIELFPFARGGPEEERINPVSVAGCVQHYMRLSTRAFLGHRFILTAYGIIARSLASSKAFVRAKFRTGAASFGEAFAALDLEQIKTYLEQCAAARKRHAPPPPIPASLSDKGIDKQFFEAIQSSCAAMPHTHEAAGEARKDMFGYHYKFGQATLFITVNPDDKNVLLVHFL